MLDATTFNAYNSNMRNLVMDKLMGAQMVVFNRLTPGEDTMPLHKLARAANRRIDILYDYTDGTTKFDDVQDPLPFDINAPVIQIKDEDYALWYRDVTEEPEKYVGKTVCFKAQVAMLRRPERGNVCPRSVRHDLLRGGHSVLRHSLPVCRFQEPCFPRLGAGDGEGKRRKASAVQGGRWPRSHGHRGCEGCSRR